MEDFKVSSVSIKLPTFWPHRAKTWFHQADAQFGLRRITEDDTKYWHVVASLDDDSATRVMKLMDNPPEKNKYEAIKAKLLDAYTLTERKRADMLLDMKDLNSKTPKEVMDSMLAIHGDCEPDYLFRRLFERLLPENIQTMLANTDIVDCEELAKAAQNLYKTGTYGEHAARKQFVPTPKKKFPASSEKFPSTDDGYCYYYKTNGAKARQCNPPCNFNPSKPSGNARAGRQ